jgi:hypothetical protein
MPCGKPLARWWDGSSAIERRHTDCEMKAPWMDPGLRELVGLSMLAGGGCGLAFAQGDLLFVAVFGVASAMAVIEAIRRSR